MYLVIGSAIWVMSRWKRAWILSTCVWGRDASYIFNWRTTNLVGSFPRKQRLKSMDSWDKGSGPVAFLARLQVVSQGVS